MYNIGKRTNECVFKAFNSIHSAATTAQSNVINQNVYKMNKSDLCLKVANNYVESTHIFYYYEYNYHSRSTAVVFVVVMVTFLGSEGRK